MGTQSQCPVSFPSFAEPLPMISLPSGATSHVRKITCRKRKNICGKGERFATTIGMLPDNVILEVFDLYRNNLPHTLRTTWKWNLLVHVCRRWRQIVFASPHRLNLQILCTHRTPVRKNLGIWPAFPIVINYRYSRGGITLGDEDNVVAALEHPDRVCYVRLAVNGSQLGEISTVMQQPFPVLTHLHISSEDGSAPALPGRFLGGTAPQLEKIYLHRIPFPSLPQLLLSTSDLVKPELRRIPPTGYISPEAIVACLAALPRLDTFHIGFRSSTSRPHRSHSPHLARTVLPSLTSFEFKGASEYLEHLVAQIDSPQLDQSFIVYFNQLLDFRAAQLSEFIDRSVGPKLALLTHARVTFFSDWVTFNIYLHENPSDLGPATITISCQGIDWQVLHIAQVLSHFSATFSNVVHLNLKVEPEGLQLQGTDDVEWHHLFHQGSAVRTLHVSQELAGHVSLALEDITGEMVAEALPSLDLIYLAGKPTSSVENFVAARKLSGRPVTVVGTKTEFNNRLDSCCGK